MRIALLDLKDPRDRVVDKTIAGGMGTASQYGSGLVSGVLTRIKAQAIRLLPYHVAYVAAILRQQGHEVSYRSGLYPLDFELAVMFTAIPSVEVDGQALRVLERYGIPALVVGTLAGVAPERYAHATRIISGEPEALFCQTDWLSRVGLEPRVPAPASASAPASARETASVREGQVLAVGQVPELDTLPEPDWSIFPRLESRYAILSPYRTVLPVVTSRGCSYPCGYYCPYPLGEGKAMRYRNEIAVAQELLHLDQRYGVRAVKFRDPILTIHRARTLRLLDALDQARRDQKLRTIWGCETHLDRLDEPLLERMAAAGCRLIQTGIETTQAEVLKASRRKSAETLHQERMLTKCRALGIKTAIYFIVGMPEDRLEGMRTSLAYAQTLPATFIQITACTPYPGTRFFDDVQDKLISRDWRRLDQYTPVLASEHFSSADLHQLMGEGYRGFYLRRQWLQQALPLALDLPLPPVSGPLS